MADSYVCSGAQMQCSLGSNISVLQVLPDRTIKLCATPMANIDDHRSENIPSFGACFSTAIPSPCTPIIPFPWERGKDDYLLRNQPALLKTSMCYCIRGGTIRLITDGQEKEGTQWVRKQPIDERVSKQNDEIIILDAYWEKEWRNTKMKIRFVPHQMRVTLFIEFIYKYDSDTHSKENALLKFNVPVGWSKGNKYIRVNDYNPQKTNLRLANKDIFRIQIKDFSNDLYHVGELLKKSL